MDIPDFKNFSIERLKELVLNYQTTKDPKVFAILLARFDRYILYLIAGYKKYTSFLRYENSQELYHTGIIGFEKALMSFKEKLQAKTLMLRIGTYVTNELRQTYRYKIRENNCIEDDEITKEILNEFYPTAFNNYSKQINISTINLLLESSVLNKSEKEIIKLKFYEELTEQQIADKVGLSHSTIHRRIVEILAKLKKHMQEN